MVMTRASRHGEELFDHGMVGHGHSLYRGGRAPYVDSVIGLCAE
jgi:hypothetical protein